MSGHYANNGAESNYDNNGSAPSHYDRLTPAAENEYEELNEGGGGNYAVLDTPDTGKKDKPYAAAAATAVPVPAYDTIQTLAVENKQPAQARRRRRTPCIIAFCCVGLLLLVGGVVLLLYFLVGFGQVSTVFNELVGATPAPTCAKTSTCPLKYEVSDIEVGPPGCRYVERTSTAVCSVEIEDACALLSDDQIGEYPILVEQISFDRAECDLRVDVVEECDCELIEEVIKTCFPSNDESAVAFAPEIGRILCDDPAVGPDSVLQNCLQVRDNSADDGFCQVTFLKYAYGGDECGYMIPADEGEITPDFYLYCDDNANYEYSGSPTVWEYDDPSCTSIGCAGSQVAWTDPFVKPTNSPTDDNYHICHARYWLNGQGSYGTEPNPCADTRYKSNGYPKLQIYLPMRRSVAASSTVQRRNSESDFVTAYKRRGVENECQDFLGRYGYVPVDDACANREGFICPAPSETDPESCNALWTGCYNEVTGEKEAYETGEWFGDDLPDLAKLCLPPYRPNQGGAYNPCAIYPKDCNGDTPICPAYQDPNAGCNGPVGGGISEGF